MTFSYSNHTDLSIIQKRLIKAGTKCDNEAELKAPYILLLASFIFSAANNEKK